MKKEKDVIPYFPFFCNNRCGNRKSDAVGLFFFCISDSYLYRI